jgi:hypothetical protein
VLGLVIDQAKLASFSLFEKENAKLSCIYLQTAESFKSEKDPLRLVLWHSHNSAFTWYLAFP